MHRSVSMPVGLQESHWRHLDWTTDGTWLSRRSDVAGSRGRRDSAADAHLETCAGADDEPRRGLTAEAVRSTIAHRRSAAGTCRPCGIARGGRLRGRDPDDVSRKRDPEVDRDRTTELEPRTCRSNGGRTGAGGRRSRESGDRRRIDLIQNGHGSRTLSDETSIAMSTDASALPEASPALVCQAADRALPQASRHERRALPGNLPRSACEAGTSPRVPAAGTGGRGRRRAGRGVPGPGLSSSRRRSAGSSNLSWWDSGACQRT